MFASLIAPTYTGDYSLMSEVKYQLEMCQYNTYAPT